MNGFSLIERIRELEAKVDELGFRMTNSMHSYNGMDFVALAPKDHEALPIYSRDAEVFTGTIEQLEVWIRGVEWARNYDRMLNLSDEKKRQRKEQDYRNKILVKVLKNVK